MIVVELALVVVFVWACVRVIFWLLDRPWGTTPTFPTAARWRIAHFDADGETHVVLQRYESRGDRVRSQHVVGTIPLNDPDYETTFLAVMDAARQRRALFEAEEDR